MNRDLVEEFLATGTGVSTVTGYAGHWDKRGHGAPPTAGRSVGDGAGALGGWPRSWPGDVRGRGRG